MNLPDIAHRRFTGACGAVPALLIMTGCGLIDDDDDRTINIIVTESAPFQEPNEIATELLEEEGWELETTYVTDINQPNQVVHNGEYDANYFQHLAFLNQFNQDDQTDVVPAFSVYYAPSGIFSLEYDSLDDLPEGAQINLPVDTANNGRALQLLADEGLIEIDEAVSVTQLSQNDITANPRDFEFLETDQQSGAQVLPDVDAGFVFVRLVPEAGHDVNETMLALEDGRDEVRIPFTCVVAVQPDQVDSEQVQALQEAFQSPEVEQWFEEYQGGVVDYVDDITVENVEEIWTDFTEEAA